MAVVFDVFVVVVFFDVFGDLDATDHAVVVRRLKGRDLDAHVGVVWIRDGEVADGWW